MAATNLILGFGGTGAHVLTFLKEFTVYKHGRKPDEVVFLEFDTIAGWDPGKTVDIANGGGSEEKIARGYEEANSLHPHTEYFQLCDQRPTLRDLVTHHLSPAGDREAFPQFKEWLHSQWLSTVMPASVLNITAGSAQQRQIGRFAMFANAESIVAKLSKSLRELARVSQGNSVNVWIVGSAAGGTGAGCLIDAGYLAKLAGQQAGIPITLLAAIVFPEVYAGKEGISRARAYSLFRELERIQEKDVQVHDRYIRDGHQCSSEVRYDDRGALRAVVPGRLFDYLVYLGRECVNEEDRIAFFSSVANALDPYIDPKVGPKMMEEQVNRNGLPFTLGGARLTMPLTTYAELFAWEMVEDVLKRLFAPRQEHRQVVGLHWGSDRDRATQARNRTAGLLPLFEELLAVAEGPADRIQHFSVNRLNPREIIEKWYQFSSADVASRGLKQDDLDYVIPLVHRNPFISLDAPEEETLPQAVVVKTFDERRKAKEAKEEQDRSRDRFATDLRAVLEGYFDPRGGEGSFEHGRRTIQKAMTEFLGSIVDRLIADEFAHRPSPDISNDGVEQGTTLTRLYGELRHLVAPEGPLSRVESMLAMVIETLQGHEKFAAQAATDALADLERARPGGLLSFGTWVEQPQRNARERYSELVSWRQKLLLTQDMRGLVATVRNRFEAWLGSFERVMSAAVLTREGNSPALRQTQEKNIHRLHDRLGRMIRDASTMISLQPGDITMQGFADTLRRAATLDQSQTIASVVMEKAKWEAVIGPDGNPALELSVGDNRFDCQALGRLHEALYQSFRPGIDQRLETFDIFDYLLYVQKQFNTGMDQVVERLSKAATVLLNVNGPGASRWVYSRPSGADKTNLADALQARLRPAAGDDLRDPVQSHSDRTSLTLLRSAEPDRIPDLDVCEKDYVNSLTNDFGRKLAEDHEVSRSLIYHGFRAEAEAWFIERQFVRESEANLGRASQLIPPRICRLLAHPDRCQALIQCLATDAVNFSGETLQWVWNDPNRDEPVPLSLPGVQKGDSFISAAVTFILQQSEARQHGRIPIALKAARDSAMARAKANHPGKPLHQVISEFVDPAKLDTFFATAFSPPTVADLPRQEKYQRELHALKLIFRFYGRPGAQSDLSSRTL